jgi:hypothetical protein
MMWHYPYTWSDILIGQTYHLDFITIRILSIVLVIAALYWVHKIIYFFNTKSGFFLTFGIFFITPGVWYLALFNLFYSLLLCSFTIFIFLWINKNNYYLLSILIIFSEIIIGYKIGLISKFNISKIVPAETSYIIDHTLSTGFLYNSPLITKTFNFNRIYYNKLIFAANEFITRGISSYDFEATVVPKYSATVLTKEYKTEGLEQLVDVWQLLILIIAVPIYFNKKYKSLIFPMFLTAFLMFLFHKDLLFLCIPVICLLLSIYIFSMSKFAKIILFCFVGLNVFNSLTFFITNYSWWMDQRDFIQSRIWQQVISRKLSDKNLIVTDRIGKPDIYAKAYMDRLNENLSFGAFKYWENSSNDIFIGFPGEFIKDGNYSEGITRGRILEKISIPRYSDNSLGSEIWIVSKI